MDLAKFKQTISIIDSKVEVYRNAGILRDWSAYVGDTDDAFLQSIDQENWEAVQVGYSWSAAKGDVWLKREFVLPEKVNGICLEGARVDLIFFLPMGSTLYRNGEQIFDEPFWADTRPFPVTLTESYKPGEKILITIKAKSGDGFGAFADARLFIDRLDQASFEHDLVREQLKFCRYLLEKKQERDASEDRAIDSALAAFDLDALQANDRDAWKKSVEAAIEHLLVFSDEAKSYKIDMIGHAHIDMNWLWTWQETVDVCCRDFSSADKLMSNYPDFRFSQSQAAAYKAMEDYHPELFKRIKERVDEGRWEVTASTWVEGDLNTALGETLVRQILYARRYIKEKFGVEPRICWEPDTFGHPVTYPQILAKSGIEHYYFYRGGKGLPIFWWEAPDGSRVLAYNELSSSNYGGEVDPAEMLRIVRMVDEKSDTKTCLWLYGVGDHGGGATARDIERAKMIDSMPALPSAKTTVTPEFYDAIKGTGVDYPVIKDELNKVFEGCYTSHSDIKWLNRYGENLLITAETLSTLAALNTSLAYPADRFVDAWRNQCFHQFHDIVCGCGIPSTYREAADTLKPSHDALFSITQESAAKLASTVDTGSGDKKIVVFNQLAWQRDDLVQVSPAELSINLGDLSDTYMQDDAGGKVPVQILDGMLTFVAKEVPALGCRVYEIVKSDATGLNCLKVDESCNTMENEYIRLRINPNSGAIDSLVIKALGRDVARPDGWVLDGNDAGMLNRFMVYFERPHYMSAWVIGDIARIDSLIADAEVKVLESGPVCATVQVKHHFLNSSLTQQIRIYNGLPRIDFVTEIDWHEKGSMSTDAPMLKTTFTPYFGDSKVVYEIPYGTIERPATGREVPALRWADISDNDCGLSLINNSKYGYNAQGSTLALTLLRATYEPDCNPEEGLHQISYSLYPHKGSWSDACTQQLSAQFNQPLLAAVDSGHPGTIVPGKAYITCKPDNVLVSAVKFAEDQPADAAVLVIRLFEYKGESTTAKLDFGWSAIKAEEADMMENPVAPIDLKDRSITLHFGKHEIKTIKLYIK